MYLLLAPINSSYSFSMLFNSVYMKPGDVSHSVQVSRSDSKKLLLITHVVL